MVSGSTRGKVTSLKSAAPSSLPSDANLADALPIRPPSLCPLHTLSLLIAPYMLSLLIAPFICRPAKVGWLVLWRAPLLARPCFFAGLAPALSVRRFPAGTRLPLVRGSVAWRCSPGGCCCYSAVPLSPCRPPPQPLLRPRCARRPPATTAGRAAPRPPPGPSRCLPLLPPPRR